MEFLIKRFNELKWGFETRNTMFMLNAGFDLVCLVAVCFGILHWLFIPFNLVMTSWIMVSEYKYQQDLEDLKEFQEDD